jgi:hypothetical protein
MAIGTPSTRGLSNTKMSGNFAGTVSRKSPVGSVDHQYQQEQKARADAKNPINALMKQMGGLGTQGQGMWSAGMGGRGNAGQNKGPMKPQQSGGVNGGGISVPGSNLSVSTQTNPQLDALIGDYQQYRGGLADATNLEGTQAMQRQRDAISGMAKEFGESAASRGLYGSGAAAQDLENRVLRPGMDSLGKLNADITSDARRQQLAALQGQGSMVGQQANVSLGQQQLGLDTWRAQQQAALQQAQLQQSQQDQGFSQLMALTGLINNMYSGF